MQIKLSTLTLAIITNSLLLAAYPAFAADTDTATAPPITPADGSTTPISTLDVTTTKAKPHHIQGNYKGAVVKPCHYPLMLRDGFYIGAQMGYDSYRTRVSTDFGFIAGDYVANPVVDSEGFVGGLFTGYGTLWSDFYYTGAEIFINGSSASQSQFVTAGLPDGSSATAWVNVKTDLSWGISFIPGVKFSDSSLLYIRLGYSQAKLRGQSSETFVDPAVGTANFQFNKKQYAGGMSYGAGIETAILKGTSIRSEWNHYGYNTFSDPSGTNYGASNNQLMVSLVYHFA